jgi:hypothetical protein
LEEAAKLSFRRLVRCPTGSGTGVDMYVWAYGIVCGVSKGEQLYQKVVSPICQILNFSPAKLEKRRVGTVLAIG